MIIRQGTKEEMLSLWYSKNTSEFFVKQIADSKAEFWTIESNGSLVGELYLFFELADNDLADGNDTAYLSAFRIVKELRGKGLGTQLMNIVFERLENLGYSYVTIGVEPTEESNIRLYRRLGFYEDVKMMSKDYCDVDEYFKPMSCSPYLLLKKNFNVNQIPT